MNHLDKIFDERTEENIGLTMTLIEGELRRSITLFPKPFNSSHEGFAVIKEEVDELWDEVKNNKKPDTNQRQQEEAIQVGAMAAKFIMQLT